jgi:hypothetical protein
MTLTERLGELVRAAFSGIYVRSAEHDDALAEIRRPAGITLPAVRLLLA